MSEAWKVWLYMSFAGFSFALYGAWFNDGTAFVIGLCELVFSALTIFNLSNKGLIKECKYEKRN